MRDRSFITAIALVAGLVAFILAGNIRDAGAPLYGPPNVDEEDVRSKVEGGSLSFEEARFYSIEEEPEENREAEDRPSEGDPAPEVDGADRVPPSRDGKEEVPSDGGDTSESDSPPRHGAEHHQGDGGEENAK